MITPTARWANEALADVDPGRTRGRFAVGLRDGALLALLAGGVTCAEASRLRCDEVTIHARSGCVVISVRRGGFRWRRVLPQHQSARVTAWLAEGGHGEPRALLVDGRGRALSRVGVSAILARYRARRRAAA